jgi:mono/diheme cytochrome c family protein
MSTQKWVAMLVILAAVLWVGACSSPDPWPADLTPIPTLAPAEKPTLAPAIQGGLEPPGAPGGEGQTSAALGAPIYLQYCSPCHGAEGEGVDAPPLRNNQYVQTAGDQALQITVAEGVPGTEMPAWLQANGGPLTDEQIASVVDYMRKLQGLSALPTATPVAGEEEQPAPPAGGPTPEPARPSEPGGPGPAASMIGDVERGRVSFGTYCAACHGPEGVQGIPNPGSDDGTVPELNPIDFTIVSSDPKVFAVNVDLFIEHGSVPEGPGPLIMMPFFGDAKMLTDQQIADLIAYVMHVNGVEETQ